MVKQRLLIKKNRMILYNDKGEINLRLLHLPSKIERIVLNLVEQMFQCQ